MGGSRNPHCLVPTLYFAHFSKITHEIEEKNCPRLPRLFLQVEGYCTFRVFHPISFTQDLMGRVVSEQPDDPYAFLIHVLERKASRMVSVCFRAHLYICYIFHTFRNFIPDEKGICINCIILFFRDTNLVGLEEAPGTSVSVRSKHVPEFCSAVENFQSIGTE